MQANVLMLRSHYPDVRASKIRNAIREWANVEMCVWCRGQCEEEEGVKKFGWPIGWQSFFVVAILPIFQLFSFFYILRRRPDFVHAADLDTILPAFFAAKIIGCKLIYDIYDYYPDMIEIDSKLVKKGLSKIDHFLLRSSNAIIIPDQNRLNQIGIDPEDAVVIYNSPESREGVATYDDGGFTLFFGGFVGPDRGIGEICQAVSEMPHIKLKVYGDANAKYREELLDKYSDFGNIELRLERIDHRTIIETTAKSQLVPILYSGIIKNNLYSSPNKLFEAMSAGVPVIAYEGSSVDEKVIRHNIGIVVEPGNNDDLMGAISTLHDDQELWESMSENALKAYNEIYSWELMKGRLRELYNDLR